MTLSEEPLSRMPDMQFVDDVRCATRDLALLAGRHPPLGIVTIAWLARSSSSKPFTNSPISRSVFSNWARAYYDQMRGRGKEHHAALRALAYKWIRILFRCWKDRTLHNEEKNIFTRVATARVIIVSRKNCLTAQLRGPYRPDNKRKAKRRRIERGFSMGLWAKMRRKSPRKPD
jgi:hypothetical protein